MNANSSAPEVATLLALLMLSIPAFAQSVPPSVPDWRDGSLSPNQIVDRSQSVKARPAEGATPSTASTALFQGLFGPCACSSLLPGGGVACQGYPPAFAYTVGYRRCELGIGNRRKGQANCGREMDQERVGYLSGVV